MIDFLEAVKRPLKGDPITIILGIIFTIVLPLRPLVHGLGIETSRRTMEHNAHAPAFDDFIDLFLTGLMVVVIAILYMVPAFIALLVGAAATLPLLASVFGSIISHPVISLQSIVGLIAGGALFGSIALFFGFLAAVMAPVGIQLFARDKRISSAFAFSEIIPIVARSEYWIAWVLITVYGAVLVGIVSVLSIPEFNALTAIFLGAAGYIWWMTWYTLFGQVVASARGKTGLSSHKSLVATPKRKLRKTR